MFPISPCCCLKYTASEGILIHLGSSHPYGAEHLRHRTQLMFAIVCIFFKHKYTNNYFFTLFCLNVSPRLKVNYLLDRTPPSLQTFQKLFFLCIQNLTFEKLLEENAQKIPKKSHKRCKNMPKTCSNGKNV